MDLLPFKGPYIGYWARHILSSKRNNTRLVWYLLVFIHTLRVLHPATGVPAHSYTHIACRSCNQAYHPICARVRYYTVNIACLAANPLSGKRDTPRYRTLSSLYRFICCIHLAIRIAHGLKQSWTFRAQQLQAGRIRASLDIFLCWWCMFFTTMKSCT
jgi:hypothetical protein